jgi:hypothetical protein
MFQDGPCLSGPNGSTTPATKGSNVHVALIQVTPVKHFNPKHVVPRMKYGFFFQPLSSLLRDRGGWRKSKRQSQDGEGTLS